MVNRRVEWVYFKGKGSWFKNLQQGDHEYKNWNVKLHFTPESYQDFMKLKDKKGEADGILNEVKKDDDGYFHVFKRPFFKDFGQGPEPLLPPEIIDADGNIWKKDDFIGNGSDITIKCELYSYKNRMSKRPGRAIRLVSVKVDNLVPFSKDDLRPAEKKMLEGLAEQPKPGDWP